MDESLSKKTPPKNTAADQSLIRLARLSKEKGISQFSQNIALNEILKSIDQDDAQNDPPSTVTSPLTNEHNHQLKVRSMIRSGADWTDISKVLGQELLREPSPENAAQVLELSLLQGKPTDVMDNFRRVVSMGIQNFYPKLHPGLRNFLIENADPSDITQINSLLFKHLSTINPTDIELTFVLLELSKSPAQTPAWNFYAKHKSSLLHNEPNRVVLGMTYDQLLSHIGHMALTLGYESEARSLLSTISSTSPLRDKALASLLKFESNALSEGKHRYVSELNSTSSWQSKLEKIDQYCRLARQHGGFNDFNRPALNSILSRLLAWMPGSKEAWESAADLLLRNRDLVKFLPEVLGEFTANVAIFHKRGLDDALWKNWLSIHPSSPKEVFLCAVALVHKFVGDYSSDEMSLWQAKTLSLTLSDTQANLYQSFQSLLTSAQDFIKTSSVYTDIERKRKLSCLRIAVQGSAASDQVIDEYLESSTVHSYNIIDQLAKHAWDNRNLLTFLNVVSRCSFLTGLSSDLINKTWSAAIKIRNLDLAWRVASVGMARYGLQKEIQNQWEISGENRSAYIPQKFDIESLEAASVGFDDVSRKFLSSLYILSPKIIELAEKTKRVGYTWRPITNPKTPQENRISSALQSSGILQPRKSIVDKIGNVETSSSMTTIVTDLKTNSWSFSLKLLIERLGWSCWGYSAGDLRILIQNKSLSNPVSRILNLDSKYGRWLNALNETERTALSDLTSSLEKLQDSEVENILPIFAVRLATLLYPANYLALSTLKLGGASEILISALEAFIIHPKYSALRLRNGLASKVEVHKSFAASPIVICD
jgi:hypothetical protein